MKTPQTVTVTFRVKYIWLIVGIIMILLAASPIIAFLYPASSTPSAPTAPSNNGSSSSGGSGSGPSAQVNCPAPCVVHIKNSVFGNGQPVVVKAGQTIVWQNNDDTSHTSTSTTNLWDTGILSPGQSSKAISFPNAGVYNYICNVHPMAGQVIVVS